VPRALDAIAREYPYGLDFDRGELKKLGPRSAFRISQHALELAKNLEPSNKGFSVINVPDTQNRCWAYGVSAAFRGDMSCYNEIRDGVLNYIKALIMLHGERSHSADFFTHGPWRVPDMVKYFLLETVSGQVTAVDLQAEQQNILRDAGGGIVALSIWSHLLVTTPYKVVVYGAVTGKNQDGSVRVTLDTIPGDYDGPTIRLFNTLGIDEPHMGGIAAGVDVQVPVSHYQVLAPVTCYLGHGHPMIDSQWFESNMNGSVEVSPMIPPMTERGAHAALSRRCALTPRRSTRSCGAGA